MRLEHEQGKVENDLVEDRASPFSNPDIEKAAPVVYLVTLIPPK